MVHFYGGDKSWNGAIIEKNSNLCEEKYIKKCSFGRRGGVARKHF